MSKNLKRLIVYTIIALVVLVLVLSDSLSIDFTKLFNWFKDGWQWIWARLAPIIPLKEILCFLAGIAAAAIVVAIRNRKK